MSLSKSDVPVGYGLPIIFSPGRFFAVWLVKMFLMHCVLNYELKPHEPASERYILGNPKSHSDIRVGMRKRKESMQQVSIQDLGSYRHPGI